MATVFSRHVVILMRYRLVNTHRVYAKANVSYFNVRTFTGL